MALHTFKI